ncbi:MAG: hypothetical protein EOP07_04665 [Proteobacteria bacterium]|nr:MAG: hypothetical protein EOP07_04665 [Pseudomonadota bacterium]
MVVTPPVVTPVPPIETPNVPTVEECTSKLSVGRIYQWIATSEGQMIPSSGTIVVKENGKNVAKVKFIGNEWHVLPTWLKNTYEAEVDLSASKGFTLTYSATADLYLQLRPSFAWSGGDKYLVKIPSTAGVSKSLTVDFKEASWTTLDSLGKPAYPLAMAVKQARGFVFVGNVPNEFAVTGLAIDGYSPPCP